MTNVYESLRGNYFKPRAWDPAKPLISGDRRDILHLQDNVSCTFSQEATIRYASLKQGYAPTKTEQGRQTIREQVKGILGIMKKWKFQGDSYTSGIKENQPRMEQVRSPQNWWLKRQIL